jgi:hypothetical protein
VWGFVTFTIAVGVAAGVPYSEAQTAAFLLAFLVFLICFCWAFTAASVGRVWTVLGGGGFAMTGAAWLMTNVLA